MRPQPANTSLAASGSTLMFHSATGVVLPRYSNAPPMITSRRSNLGNAGSSRRANATLVSGPVATPISSPGWACAASIHACTASYGVSWRSVDGSVAYPSPCGPWVSSAVRSGELTGWSEPFDTGTPSIRHSSSSPRLFWQTCCTGTFPAVEAMPTSSASGLPNRYASAIASSTPVSTSANTGCGTRVTLPPSSGYQCTPGTRRTARFTRRGTRTFVTALTGRLGRRDGGFGGFSSIPRAAAESG